MSYLYILSQIFAVAAFLSLMASVWCKTRNKILLLQILGGLMYAIQYLILQYDTGFGLSGAVINLIGILRTFVLMRKVPGDKRFAYVLGGLLFLYSGTAILTWHGIGSVFSYLTCVTSTIGLYHSNTNKIRTFSCLTCIFWILYDGIIGAYVAILGEICIIISNITSMIKVGANTHELEQWRLTWKNKIM